MPTTATTPTPCCSSTSATFPGCHVWARPVGVLRMADEKGVDFKVLCVALADPLYRHVDALRQVSPHKLLEIEQFFQTYKNLEDKSVELDGWAGVAETLEILRNDRQRWLDEQRALAADARRHGCNAGRGSRGRRVLAVASRFELIEVAGREVKVTNPARSTGRVRATPSSTSCATTSRWPTVP